jgi:hypothetical protein
MRLQDIYWLALLLLLIGALSVTPGCAQKEPIVKYETIEVRVPVQVIPEPPPELLAPIKAPLPEFVPPDDPAASSALTSEGEQRLKRLLVILHGRSLAWEAWVGK